MRIRRPLENFPLVPLPSRILDLKTDGTVTVSGATADVKSTHGSSAPDAVGAGDEFEAFVSQWHGRVHRLAARLLGWRDGADDVVQQVFLTILEKRASPADIRDVGRWIATVTLNICRRRYRREFVWRKCLPWLAGRPETAISAGATDVQDERRERIRRVIGDLPQKNREVIVLRYLEELDVAEIAAIVGATSESVAMRLSRGREMLRKALSDDDGFDGSEVGHE